MTGMEDSTLQETALLSPEQEALRLQAIGDVSKLTPEQIRAFMIQAGAALGGTSLPSLQDNIGINPDVTQVAKVNLGELNSPTFNEGAAAIQRQMQGTTTGIG